jgi:hypothetical protein
VELGGWLNRPQLRGQTGKTKCGIELPTAAGPALAALHCVEEVAAGDQLNGREREYKQAVETKRAGTIW